MSFYLFLHFYLCAYFLFLCSILHGTLSDDSEALDLSTTNSPAEPLRSPSPDKNMMDSLSSRDPKKASAPCIQEILDLMGSFALGDVNKYGQVIFLSSPLLIIQPIFCHQEWVLLLFLMTKDAYTNLYGANS